LAALSQNCIYQINECCGLSFSKKDFYLKNHSQYAKTGSEGNKNRKVDGLYSFSL
jgi:hypothetical protein